MSLALALFAALTLQDAKATDDFNFAQGLQDRGLFDLAAEVFKSIETNASLPADKRAEGKLGLAMLAMAQAERAPSLKQRLELYDKSIGDLETFIKENPNNPRVPEVMGNIAYVMREKARAYAKQAKNDKEKLQAALDCLARAEALFQGKVEGLQKQIKDIQKSIVDEASKEQKAAMEAIDEKLCDAMYNWGLSLFGYVDVLKDIPTQRQLLLTKIDKLIDVFDEISMSYGNSFAAFEGATFLGRAYFAKAKLSTREDAEKLWKLGLDALAVPRSLLEDKEAAKDTVIRDLAANALYVEIQVRVDYGDFVKGAKGLQVYKDAAELPEKCGIFKLYPTLDSENIGRRINIERARAYYKSGDAKNAKKTEDLALKGTSADSVYRIIVMTMQSAFGGDMTAEKLVEIARTLTNSNRIISAILRWKEAADKLEKGGGKDVKLLEECYTSMGDLYYDTHRFHEAARAFALLDDARFPDTVRESAAVKRKRALGSIARNSKKDPIADKELADWNNTMRTKYPKAVSGEELMSAVWSAFEAKDFPGVIKNAATIPGDKPTLVEEATFLVGRAYYAMAREKADAAKTEKVKELKERAVAEAAENYRKAIDAFDKHVRLVKSAANKDAVMVRRAVVSLHFLTLAAVKPEVNQPQKALDASEKLLENFGTGDGKALMTILGNRIDAHLMLVTDADTTHLSLAEQDLAELEGLFARLQANPVIVAFALNAVSNTLRVQGERLAQKDAAAGEALKEKAGDLFVRALNIQDVPEDAPPEVLITYAEQFFDMAKRKNDKARFARAAALYEKARYLGNLSADMKNAIDSKMAECFVAAGDFDKAIEILKGLTRDDPRRTRIYMWQPLADAYRDKAKKETDPAVKRDLLQKAVEIYGGCAALLRQAGKQEAKFWELLYEYAETLRISQSYDKLYDFLAAQLRSTPDWDRGEFNHPDGTKISVKFEEIVRKYGAVGNKPLPPRTKPPENPPPPPPPTPEPPKNP